MRPLRSQMRPSESTVPAPRIRALLLTTLTPLTGMPLSGRTRCVASTVGKRNRGLGKQRFPRRHGTRLVEEERYVLRVQ
ncbi:hypothetical protein D3C75_489110 [compost metagenome]